MTEVQDLNIDATRNGNVFKIFFFGGVALLQAAKDLSNYWLFNIITRLELLDDGLGAVLGKVQLKVVAQSVGDLVQVVHSDGCACDFVARNMEPLSQHVQLALA